MMASGAYKAADGSNCQVIVGNWGPQGTWHLSIVDASGVPSAAAVLPAKVGQAVCAALLSDIAFSYERYATKTPPDFDASEYAAIFNPQPKKGLGARNPKPITKSSHPHDLRMIGGVWHQKGPKEPESAWVPVEPQPKKGKK